MYYEITVSRDDRRPGEELPGFFVWRGWIFRISIWYKTFYEKRRTPLRLTPPTLAGRPRRTGYPRNRPEIPQNLSNSRKLQDV
jgi:hypothetical protein